MRKVIQSYLKQNEEKSFEIHEYVHDKSVYKKSK